MSHTYLTTPFKDKDAVKALGARWDPDARKWYVPAGRDLAPFADWLPAQAGAAVAVLQAPAAEVAAPRPRASRCRS